MEFEYRPMSKTTSEIEWMVGLHRELLVPVQLLLAIYYDNKIAQYKATNPIFHNGTKILT